MEISEIKILRKHIWPSKRKLCMKNAHQSRVESVERNRYYLRNQKRNVNVLRTCGKNARRKKFEEGV